MSEHWYARDGTPTHKVPYADPTKGFRKTTLSDARKLHLVPSVTTVLQVLAQPYLERWKQEQVLLSALKTPSNPGESLSNYKTRIFTESRKKAEDAAKIGTRIHGLVENYFKGDITDTDREENKTLFENIENCLYEVYQSSVVWQSEMKFSHPKGYGGTVDLWSGCGIVDYKTKDFNEKKDVKSMAWDDMGMQLAAYGQGLLDNPDSILCNIFISRTVPGLIKHHVWPDKKILLDKFNLLLQYWQLSKNYDSSYEED
jgi:hypothetical protein